MVERLEIVVPGLTEERARPSRRRSAVRVALVASLVLAAIPIPWSLSAGVSGTAMSWTSEAEASVDLAGVSLSVNAAINGSPVLEWTVRNQGTDAAVGGWTDSVYVSQAPTCCAGATLLGGLDWPTGSAVGPGATYTQRVSVQMPPLPLGDYYVFVRVNAPQRLAEATVANNDVAATFRVAPNVQLSTIELVAPALAVSRQSISVSWTVENRSGIGSTEDATATLWQDNLYISPNRTCCADATFLGSWSHTGGLRARQRYTQTQTVAVPAIPAGDYYIIVSVDATNAQAEQDEDNQRAIPIKVTTPDLVPTSLRAPTSPAIASSQQTVSVSWSVANRGTASTTSGWEDSLYISPSATCCAGAVPIGSWPSTATLVPNATYAQVKSIAVPTLGAGSYYLILWANATGTLHEENEANSRLAIPLTITTPDLTPTALSAPAAAATGQGVTVSWSVKNAGTGPTVGTWADKLSLSSTATCCEGTTLLGRWDRSALAAGSSYTQTKTLTLPPLAAGNYYLILDTDGDEALYEASESNNRRLIPISITTPDLVPIALAGPPTVSTQQAITVSWTVKNQGTATTSKTWVDTLHLSPTSGCCAGAVTLGQWTWATPVAAGATYTQTKSVTVPPVAAGSYHLVLLTDAAAALREVNEGDNQRAVPMTVTTPDLLPTALTAPATAETGHAISLSWTVRNQGTGSTTGSWTDKVYVSASATCCAGTTSLGSWPRPATLAAGASYTQTRSVTIPPLAAGSYYLTVWADADGQLHEASDSNNQRAVTVTVASTSVSPATVLAITSVNGGDDPTAVAAFPVVVQARDLGGISRNVKAATTVRLSLKSGTGVLGGTVTGTIPAGASQVTITGITYRKAENGVALTASRTSGDVLSAGHSGAFAVRPGAVASYAITLSSPAPAGTTFPVTVTARDQFANTVTTDSSTVVTLRSPSGHIQFDADGDGVFGDAARALSGGIFRVNARGTTAESTSVIAADAVGKTGSVPLTVTAGAARVLAFTKQPGSATAGGIIPGPPTVAVQDGFGNAVASTASVTIAIGTNPGGGALGGSTIKNAAAGIVIFSNLTINQPGSGYTLIATSPGLTPATTGSFTVTGTTGAISGRVTRTSDGAGIVAATVEALQGSLVKGSTSTGPDGAYTLAGLAPGSHSVRASAAGYQAQTRAGVTVATGATAVANFNLSATAGPTIRITAPVEGSLIGRPVVLVRGEISAPVGPESGVSVNGTPAFVESGQFAALVAVESGAQTLTAILSTASVPVGQDAVSVQVILDPSARRVVLTASPRSGTAPLTVTLRAAVTTATADYSWDADGDGIVDRSGATLNEVTVHYLAPGLYFPKVTVRDTQGTQVSEETPILVLAQNTLLALLEGKWQAFKDALRVGNVTGALLFIAESRRNHYQQILQNLTVPLSQIDLVLGDVRFVQVRGNTVEYEMLRTDERGRLSYLVRFAVDVDGIWRLKDL